MYLFFIYIIKYIEENKMWGELFYALGLHLWTMQQWFLLLCSISYIELGLMFFYLWKKDYFIEKGDGIFLMMAIPFILYVLYIVEHVKILFSLLYINCFLLAIFIICLQYKNKNK